MDSDGGRCAERCSAKGAFGGCAADWFAVRVPDQMVVGDIAPRQRWCAANFAASNTVTDGD